MQLLKVQERINALPQNPASLAYLDRAAKGMDTEIPPFMALAGMNEMKRNMEYASAGQPPEEPINQSLPKQLAQQMGLGQPMQPGQQMQPGQPMQPMQPGQQMQPGQPMQPGQQLAQGIAQPMPQQMPQQMAGGGLASVPLDPRMFDYGSGGVVSFAVGSELPVQLGEGFDAGGIGADDEETSAEELKARRKQLMLEIDAERNAAGPPQETADVIDARRRKEGNYGADKGPLGEEYLTGLAQIQKLREAERARQAEDNKSRDLSGLGNALIAAGNATRGQSGMGAFLGGLGQQAGQEMMASQQRDAALRGQSITETEILNEAKNKVQGLRQAKLSGDVAQVVKLQSELADLASKAKKAKLDSLSTEITAIARIEAARITAGKPRADTKVAEQHAKMGIDLAEAKNALELDPNNPAKKDAVRQLTSNYAALTATLKELQQRVIDSTSNVTSTSNIKTDVPEGGPKDEVAQAQVRVAEAKQVADNAKTAEDQRLAREKLAVEVQKLVEVGLNKFKIFNAEYRQLSIGSDADKAKAAALLRAEEARLRGANTPPAAPAAVATPVAPAAPAAAGSPITPAQFAAKWATLQPGQKLVGPDGIEYTKK